MEGSTGVHYIPKWTEASITAMIIALGFFIFAMAVKYLPIFEDAHHALPVAAADTAAKKMPELTLVH